MPLIEEGFVVLGPQGQTPAGNTEGYTETSASYQALMMAYAELKKRYNDLEQKHGLLKKAKQRQQDQSLSRSSPRRSFDFNQAPSREESPQFTVNGGSSQAMEAVSGSQHSPQQLEMIVRDLTERCRDIERANDELCMENAESKQTQHSLSVQFRTKESELMDKNKRLENESENYLRKIISLEKKLTLMEKQFLEQQKKNSLLEEECMLSKSELQQYMGSFPAGHERGNEGDSSISVIDDLKGHVRRYRMELQDLETVVLDQQKIIEKLLDQGTRRHQILCSHVSLSKSSSSGARPKTNVSQKLPSFRSGRFGGCNIEPGPEERPRARDVEHLRIPFEALVHDKYHKRSSSQGSYDCSNVPESGDPSDTDPKRQYLVNEPGLYKEDRMSKWLGQLHLARNDSLEHLHDDDNHDDEDIYGNLDCLDNLGNNDTADPDEFGNHPDNVRRPSAPEILLPSPEGDCSTTGLSVNQAKIPDRLRTSQYGCSTIPRQSVKVRRNMGINDDGNIQMPRSSGIGSPPVHELENRYRPNSVSQQPRALNIERNEDDTNIRRSYDNTTQNINLNIQTEKDRPERPSELVLNNDPLAGHKVIPNRNLYNEDMYIKGGESKEGRQVTNPVERHRICPVCNADFPVSIPMDQFQQHVLDCCDSSEAGTLNPLEDQERICPVCGDDFPNTVQQRDYEAHVAGHFEDEEVTNQFEGMES